LEAQLESASFLLLAQAQKLRKEQEGRPHAEQTAAALRTLGEDLHTSAAAAEAARVQVTL